MSDCKAKMHQIHFRLGLRSRPRWSSLQRSPKPLTEFKGPTSTGEDGKGRVEGREGKGRKKEGRGVNARGEKGGEGIEREEM